MREQSGFSLNESEATTPVATEQTPTNPLTCPTCGKTYSRIDHLERHSRSHLQLKPFSCSTCGKAFARADALKRHEGNHDGETPAKRRKTPQASHPRAGQACHSCAAAKLRCEDEKPCARCKRKGISCVFAKSTRTPDHARVSILPPERHHGRHADNDMMSIDVDVPSPAFAQQQDQATLGANPSSMGISSRRPQSTGPQDTRQLTLDEVPQVQAMQSFPSDVPDMFGESSLADFLNDVMLPTTFAANELPPLETQQANQTYAQRDFLDFGTSWIDFVEVDALLQDHDAELGLRPTNVSFALPRSGSQTPYGAREAAFSRSMWRWVPTKRDHGGADQPHLSLPYANMNSPETRSVARSLLPNQHIDQSVRDQILALILSTCDKSIYSDVVSSFPSAELLDGLMHYYLNTQFLQIDSWFHVPTFVIEEQEPELLIAIIAAGGVISTVSAIRKLGFALAAAAKDALGVKFERDNRYTRNVGCIQGLALVGAIGLFSGDKRKMEIAEAFAMPPITMMRRSGKFARSQGHMSPPAYGDSPEVLRAKWVEWIHSESYKRLAIHFLIHDAQASMALQAPPLLSPPEMTLDLPASRNLWFANSAETWRDYYLLPENRPDGERGLSIAQSISHVAQIRDQNGVDIALSALIAVYCTWTAVWNQLQLHALLRATTPSQSTEDILLPSRSSDNDLSPLLERFRMILGDWSDHFRPEMALVLERTMLNMHLSFEQVQLFAGKEGEGEARRVFPILQQWSMSIEARKAIWHAGQVLKAARQCHVKHLRGFGAICLYHAGMAFWTYAIVSASTTEQPHVQHERRASVAATKSSTSELVWLDGDDVPAVQRFTALGRGTPVLSDFTHKRDTGNVLPILLGNPKAIMEACIELLKQTSEMEGDGTLPPLVENLSQLMQDLGNAAQELLQGGLRRSKETHSTHR